MSNSQMFFQIDKHISGIVCIPSIRINKHANVDIPIMKSFDFGNALESVYPLLDIIFTYLDYNDLKSVSAVKKSWEVIADKILEKRNQPSWISFSRKSREQPSFSLVSSQAFKYNNVGLSLIFSNYKRLKLNKYICLHNTPELIRMTFAEYISKEVVPKDVDYCVISCRAITSFFQKGIMEHTEKGIFFQGISLPQIPNIRTTMFHCQPKFPKCIKDTLDAHMQPNEEVKCLLLFSVNDPHHYIESFLEVMLEGHEPRNVALAGGVVKGTKCFQKVTSQRNFTASDFFCITFLQERDVKADFNASSIVICSDDLTYDDFENEMVTLKRNSVMRTQGTAFRICCASKCVKEKESPLFNKHFPGIPLLGIEVDGEFGWDTFKEVPQEDSSSGEASAPKKKRLMLPEMQHQWSTIIVLLTWGKKI